MESCGFERGFKSSDTIAVQCYGGSRQWYSSFSGAGCGLLAHRYETTPNQNHTKEYSSHHFSFEETSFYALDGVDSRRLPVCEQPNPNSAPAAGLLLPEA